MRWWPAATSIQGRRAYVRAEYAHRQAEAQQAQQAETTALSAAAEKPLYERELARAARAGQAVGAERVEVDPATGVISMILKPDKGGGSNRNTWDEVLGDEDAKRPA